MGHLLMLCSLFLFLISFANPTFSQSNNASQPPESTSELHGIAKNRKAPNFKSPTLKGETIELSDFRGQYVLIEFWGTWCQPCIEDLPYFKKAYTRYGNDIKFIGIAVDEREKVLEFINEYEIEWTQIVTTVNSTIAESFNIKMFPAVFLINPEGKILNGARTLKERLKFKGEQLTISLEEYLHQ